MSYFRDGRMGVTSFDRLVNEIRQAHGAVEAHTRDSLKFAVAAGEALYRAKEQMEHGRFMRWVSKQCRMSHETANLYMRLASGWETIQASTNSQHVKTLGLGAVDRWLRERKKVNRKADTGAATLLGRPPELVKEFRRIAGVLDRFFQPPARLCEAFDRLLPRLDARELEDVRAVLTELKRRADQAIVRVDAYLSGEMKRLEQEENQRGAALLATWAEEDGVFDGFNIAPEVREPAAEASEAVTSELVTVQ